MGAHWVRSAVILSMGVVLVGGCSSGNVAPVDGTVTLDGKPLEGAMVVFTPKEGGRPSFGKTDADGYYELVYTQDKEGAEIGKHLVTISTYQEGGGYGGEAKDTPEKVPAKYNANSNLTRTVPSGGATIDFKLDSKGEIIESGGGYGGGGYGGGGYGRGGYGGY